MHCINLLSFLMFPIVVDDACKEMRCGGSCQYNYGSNEFSCTCPENTYLNDDGSSCVQFSEPTHNEGKEHMIMEFQGKN